MSENSASSDPAAKRTASGMLRERDPRTRGSRSAKGNSLGAVVPEAPLERSEQGLRPAAEGWFVLNGRDAQWFDGEMGVFTPFHGEEAPFEQVGFNLAILRPGEPNGMYHGEDAQEDFLVLSGECLLLIEGEERRLRAWDFVHCRPTTG